MKRNKEKARKMRSGTSPYARYSKKPYRYSESLRAWEGQFIAREREINLRAQGNEGTKKRAAKLSRLHLRRAGK